MNFEINSFIDFLFSSPARPPCTYNINIDCETKFPILLHILLTGGKKLYNLENVKDITEKQFDKLNEYIESIGFTTKYNYTFDENDEEKITHVNIWFVPYIQPIFNNNCGIYMK